MKKSKYLLTSILILSAILLGACNLPTTESTEDVDATTIAATSAVVFTQAAETAIVSLPSATTAPIATAIPTNTIAPTIPPATATNTPIPCNRASFVKDVNYPDNTEVLPNTVFTKTWQIKNNGSCTWTSGYVLLFDSGDQMGASATAPITGGTVSPGATIEISVNLTSPVAAGTYQGKFKLRSGDNIVFGINANGQEPFWVKIVVPVPTPTPGVPTLPPPPPPLHSSGSLNIGSSYNVDLDEGVIAPLASDRDFKFDAVTATEKYITSQNSAAFVDKGVTLPSKTQCSGITISLIKIPLSSSLVNHYFCYKTNLGRVGYFKITAYNGSTLSIDYRTWE